MCLFNDWREKCFLCVAKNKNKTKHTHKKATFQVRHVPSIDNQLVLCNCAYIVFGKPHYFMNAHPLRSLDPPCFDCTLLVHITTTPKIRHSTIISATLPSILPTIVAIMVVLDIGARGGTEFRVKYIQTECTKVVNMI